MRTIFCSALLLSSVISTLAQLASISALPHSISLAKRGEKDDRTREAFVRAGYCWQYRDKMDDWSTCEDHCGYNMGDGPMGCLAALGRENYKYQNDAGEWFNPGHCMCYEDGLGIALPILNAVLEAMRELGEFLCEYLLPAAQLVIDLAITFAPGGPAINASLRTFIIAAKTLNNNGYGADAFGSWYGGYCPPGNFMDDITNIWTTWISVPDEVVPGKPCIKGKGKCKRKQEPTPWRNPPSQAPKTQEPPKTTKKEDPETSKPTPTPTENPGGGKVSKTTGEPRSTSLSATTSGNSTEIPERPTGSASQVTLSTVTVSGSPTGTTTWTSTSSSVPMCTIEPYFKRDIQELVVRDSWMGFNPVRQRSVRIVLME